MRLKKDSSSWHAMGLKKRYDESRFVDGMTGRRKKKDKKKWCKGIEGRKHDIEWRVAKRYNWRSFSSLRRNKDTMEIACKICDKSFYIDFNFRSLKRGGKTNKDILEEFKKKLG